MLRVHHREVGGEAGHGCFFRAVLTSARRRRCATRRSARRSAAPAAGCVISHSRAVSSSSSSVAIAAAGDSCQTLGPSRSSITARIGAPRAACRRSPAPRRSAAAGSPGRWYGISGTWPDLHHVVRRDRRHDVGRAPHAGQRQRDQVRAVGVDDAARARRRRRRCARCSASVLLARSPASCSPSASTCASRVGVEKAEAGIGRRDQEAAVGQPHADVAGGRMHVAALEQRAADAADLVRAARRLVRSSRTCASQRLA